MGLGCGVVKTGQVASDTGDLPGDHLNSPGVIPVKCWTNQNRIVLTFGFFYSLRIVNMDDGEFERAIRQTFVAPPTGRHPATCPALTGRPNSPAPHSS